MGDLGRVAWRAAVVAALALSAWAVMAPDGGTQEARADGGYVNPKPVPSPQDSLRRPGRLTGERDVDRDYIGARISNTLTQDSGGQDEPLRFDTIDVASCECFDPDRPTRITLPYRGMWEVRAHVTVLGLGYGHRPASDVVLEVKRAGDRTGYVAFDVISDADPSSANALNAMGTDWFNAGDAVEVFVTPAGTAVEANWPGRANMSPVVTVRYLGD